MEVLQIPKEFQEGLVKRILEKTPLEPRLNSELEVRLKSSDNKSGVNQPFFVQTLEFLQTFDGWQSKKQTESIDYYYGNNIRTTLTGSDSSTIRKNRIGFRDINVSGNSNVSVVRISHTTEEPVDPKELVDLTLVRYKQRSSFVYTDKYNDTWSYDLTKVWEGKVASEVRQRQLTTPPDQYEVEVEKVGTQFRSLDHLVVSLLLQAISILRPSNVRLHDD